MPLTKIESTVRLPPMCVVRCLLLSLLSFVWLIFSLRAFSALSFSPFGSKILQPSSPTDAARGYQALCDCLEAEEMLLACPTTVPTATAAPSAWF